ncbi:Mrp/NBP35 family ATP-binding protein [Arcobacter sp. FWKO B]|uniref:Mrp/NBP35 family ATP-binding protein n=1 Tax=Arcobacter sp. FWKO B TaxID=2593672 RepID=UPI0018A3AD54|nr:Mrp/NBP35 family ATP-binding protein [Arcobacter sp. FWKO B]QOG12402.1 AAA family ATPase [Arcobacter sp. FWKO B]
MSENQIIEVLKNIKYPNLEKNIVDLSLIDNISFNNNKLDIALKIVNMEAFEILSQNIKTNTNLQKQFENINIINKIEAPKKSMNYGSTQNPNNRAPYAKNIIAVSSGKGGVGKSTVAANIAVSLAQDGYKVGILDADVYGPNIPRMLGVDGESLKWNDQDKIIPSINFGVKVMSVGLTTPSIDTPLVWRSSVAVSALIQFLEDVDWGLLDYLVIDMPPGTGDVQLTMAQELKLSGAVIVTTPQMASIDDVSRSIMMFKDVGVKIFGLVENMSYFIAPDTKQKYDIFGSGRGAELSVKYGIDFLGEIPLSMEIRENCDSGKPPVVLKDETIRGYYKNITAKIITKTKK